MKILRFPSASIIKIKTTRTLAAYRTVLEAQFVTFVFLINGIIAKLLI